MNVDELFVTFDKIVPTLLLGDDDSIEFTRAFGSNDEPDLDDLVSFTGLTALVNSSGHCVGVCNVRILDHDQLMSDFEEHQRSIVSGASDNCNGFAISHILKFKRSVAVSTEHQSTVSFWSKGTCLLMQLHDVFRKMLWTLGAL